MLIPPRLAEGASFNTIKRRLQTRAPTISRWKPRLRASRLDGLDTYHPGQSARVLTPALRARILAATRKKPSDGSTHWSCRKLASALGVSKDAEHRVWKEAGLKPHRLERYMASDDPEFEAKAADILGLYLRPPQHAAVLRAALWRQWKTPRRRCAALLGLGVRPRLATNTAGSGRGPWYLARAKALSVGLPNAYFKSLGLPTLSTGASATISNRRVRARTHGGVAGVGR
jgi:homeodomain-containing protein